MDELIERFSESADLDPADVEARWAGRPDIIMEDLFRVPLEDGSLKPLTLFNPYQRQFVHAYFYGDASTMTFLKGRRVGGSFIAMACFLLEALGSPNALYPLVAKKETQAFSRVNDVKILAENAVIEIPFAKNPTQSEVVLWNGAKFKAYTSAPDSSRGDGSKSILFDEMAFMDDQKAMLAAFRPMLSLSNGKLVQISTIHAENDHFMRSFKRGTLTGKDDEGGKVGTISLYQPTFNNAEDIDIEVSLYDQHLEPARDDLNVSVIEEARAEDPMNFAQEYLCRPALEEYRFLDPDSIDRAMNRSLEPEYDTSGRASRLFETTVMAVDVGHTSDDTTISIIDHDGLERFERFHEVVRNEALREAGVSDPDRGNPNHLAARICQLYEHYDCSNVVIDATSGGRPLWRVLEARIGRGIVGFNFSATKQVHKMWGQLNAGLRADQLTLLDDQLLRDQMNAITRVQKEDWSTPRFSGKENGPEGKDDLAVAVAMAAYPPGFDAANASAPVGKHEEHPVIPRPEAEYDEHSTSTKRSVAKQRDVDPAFGSTRIKTRGGRSRYRSRYAR